MQNKCSALRSAKTCAVVDTNVGITEKTTALVDMDLTAMVKVLEFATQLERFISLYSPEINFFMEVKTHA